MRDRRLSYRILFLALLVIFGLKTDAREVPTAGSSLSILLTSSFALVTTGV